MTFDNDGTVQAQSGGKVTLAGGAGEFGGSGIYQALDGGEITITNNAVVRNTTFDTTGNGLIRALTGNQTVFHNVTNQGAIHIDDDAILEINSTFVNSGTASLDGATGASQVLIGTNTALSGGGTSADPLSATT